MSLHKKIAPSAIILIIALFSLNVKPLFAADQWDTTDPAGSESPSDLDSLITTNNDVLDRLLADYRQGATLEYSSASELTVSSGQVVCDNSGRTLRKWRENTSSTTVVWGNLDSGSEQASTTYYVYAVADTDATTFTITISTSSSAPSGATYYRRLGSFYNDSSSDITYEDVRNDGFFTTKLGGWESKSGDTVYQAATDGIVLAWGSRSGEPPGVEGYTDSSNPPTTRRIASREGEYGDTSRQSITMPVKKGDYWKVVGQNFSWGDVYWIPSEIE